MTSSSFRALTATTETDTAPADDTEAPANDGSEEEAADGIAGPMGSCTPQRTEELACPDHQQFTQQTSNFYQRPTNKLN